MILSGKNGKDAPLLSTTIHNPRRGEVWDVDFKGYIGTEIQDIRPAVVVNINSIKHLKIRLIAPITSWNKEYLGKIWIVNIKPNDFNGLRWESAVNTMQIKGQMCNALLKNVVNLPQRRWMILLQQLLTTNKRYFI